MPLIEITFVVHYVDDKSDLLTVPIKVADEDTVDHRVLHVETPVLTLGAFVDHLTPFFPTSLVPITYISRVINYKYGLHLSDLFGHNVVTQLHVRASKFCRGTDPNQLLVHHT